MPRLLISAAHTMENPGQIFQDLKEADITRKLLKKTIFYLEQYKIVFQAVPLDLPLLQRIEWINSTEFSEEQGDIFIEIHVNDGGKRGIEGWYKGATGVENKSQKLSETIVNGICKYTGYQSQGAKSEYDHELGSLLILNQINCIGTAVECLYIDNAEDIQIIKDDSKLEQLAKAIADSIKDYVDLIGKITTPPTNNQFNPNIQTPQQSGSNVASFSQAGLGAISQSGITAPGPSLPSFAPPTSPFGANTGSLFNSTGAGVKPFSPVQSPAAASGGSKSLVMDREERKEMIKKIYKKILGKEPNQTDLNFHLNTGTSEKDLIDKLLDGADHEKLLKEAAEAKEIKDKLQKMEIEITQLQTNSTDLKAMHDNLNRLLQHKNMLIAKLQQELANNNIVLSGQQVGSLFNQKNSPTLLTTNQQEKVSTNLAQRIMRILKI